MGLSGGILLIESDALVHDVFAWVWPPALLVLVVWMFIQARRQMHSRTGRWVLYPVLAALALASVGAGYETVRESVDANVYAMPGQLVDVGGHKLHLYCTGSGSPRWCWSRARAKCPPSSVGVIDAIDPEKPSVSRRSRAGGGRCCGPAGRSSGSTNPSTLRTCSWSRQCFPWSSMAPPAVCWLNT
jgi:hypothetical protein